MDRSALGTLRRPASTAPGSMNDGPEYESWRDDPAPDLPVTATLAVELRGGFGHR